MDKWVNGRIKKRGEGGRKLGTFEKRQYRARAAQGCNRNANCHSRARYNFTTFDFARNHRRRRPLEAQRCCAAAAARYVHLGALIYITIARTHCPSYNFRFVTPSSTSVQKGGRYRSSRSIVLLTTESRRYLASMEAAAAAPVDTGSDDDRIIN